MNKKEMIEKEIKIKRELGLLLLNNFPERSFSNKNGYKNCFVIKFNNFIELSIFTRFLIDVNIKFDLLNRANFLMRMVDIYVSKKGLVMASSFGYWSPILVNQVREHYSISFYDFYNLLSKNEILSPKLTPLVEEAFNFKSTFGTKSNNEITYFLKFK